MTTLIKPAAHLGTQNRTAFKRQTACVDFNGTDEKMASAAAAASLGIANIWSIATWWKPATGAVAYIVEFKEPAHGGQDWIALYVSPGPIFEVYMYETTAGTLFKRYQWANLQTDNAWNFIVVTWDGDNDELLLYKDGVVMVPSNLHTDDPGTLVSRDRVVRIMGTTNFGYQEGRMYSIGLWNKALSVSEVGSLHNGGKGAAVDWSRPYNNYQSSNNLQHWWRVGNVSTDMGADSGRGPAIDVDVDSENITAGDDRVTDYPGI